MLPNRRTGLFVNGGIILLSLLFLSGCGVYKRYKEAFFGGSTPTLHLAVVADMSGGSKTVGEAFINGAKLYLDKINRAGGINGRKVVLDVYDDRNKPELAREEAMKIVEDGRALAVIGHHYSSCSIAGGEIYKEAGIPAVTPASTNVKVTLDNPWYFRSSFNDNAQGRFLANYARMVFNQPTVSIIYEDDAFGSYLARVFAQASRELGSEVRYTWRFKGDERNLENKMARIVSDLKSKEDAGVVFLAVHSGPGVSLLKIMKDALVLNPIMGPDSFASEVFRNGFDDFNRFPKEKQTPGYYTNGMYVTTPIIFDTTDEKGQTFIKDYRREFGKRPGWHAAFAYDTTMVIVQALKNSEIIGTEDSLPTDRELIRDQLALMNDISVAVEGVTGYNYFDKNGDSRKPVLIGVYKSRNIVSALTQFRTVTNPVEQTMLQTAAKKDQVFEFQGQFMYRINVVYTGVQINEITEIDFSDLTCTLDFYIWFRYQGGTNLKDVIFLNAVEDIELGDPLEDRRTKGQLNYHLYHIKGRFRMDFITDRYGYGEHIIGVSFRHPLLDRNNLIYVKDVLGMGGESDEREVIDKMRRDQVLPPSYQWLINSVWFFQDTVEENALGNPDYLDITGGRVNFSRFNYGVQIVPDKFILRNIIPKEWVVYLLFISTLFVIGLLALVSRPKFAPFSRLIWFFQLIFTFVLLLSAEYYMVNNVGRTYYLEPIIITFAMLWWVIPAILANLGVVRFVWEPIEEKTGRPVPHIIRHSVAIIIFTMAFFGIVAFVFNQRLTSLLATSGVIAMIIGLAVQMNIANIFSGIAINVERPFRVGDWIRIDTHKEGRVVDINWRSTRIKTRDGTILCIPNSRASESPIENFSYPEDGFWMYFTIHVDPVHAPERVTKILRDAAMATNGVEKDPPPNSRFLGLTAGPTGESKSWAANYLVSVYVRNYGDKYAHNEAVWNNIWNHLRRANIKHIIERQEMHMVLEGVRKHKQIADKSLTILEELELFKPFSQEAKIYLSRRMKRHHYYPGDSIVRQGETGKSLFIVEEGVVGVRVKFENKPNAMEVARMGAGNLFGEMALLTGEKRTATIISITETYLYEITKEDIAPLLARSPKISRRLSDILTERKMLTESQKHAGDDKGMDKSTIASQIFNRIQNFFGIKK